MPTYPFEHLHATEHDATRYQRTILLITAVICLQLALTRNGTVSPWLFCLTLPILIPRWMLAAHELFHVRKAADLDLVTRLLPLGFAPLVLGYTEYQAIHFGHHTAMCTPADPEWFQLRGNYLQGWLNAMTMPEQALTGWVRRFGVDRGLAQTLGIQLGLFSLLIYWMGVNFWWYWLPARISYSAATFSFFYLLHRRGTQIGVFPVRLQKWVAWVFGILYGTDALQATCHHDLHHANPRLAARNLTRASTLGVPSV